MKKICGIALVALTSVSLLVPLKGYAELGDRTLSKGIVHNDVKELQEYLLTKGEFPYHTATGYYGSITEEAVKAFQKKRNLQVDGVAGPVTNHAIKVLRSGELGRPVTELQRLLKIWGLYDGPADGIYGEGTKNAVIKFQENKGLSVDGIAGPQTFNELNKKEAEVEKHIKELTVESTSYTANCKGCSGITKLGIDLNKYPNGKVVAVDPNVIPLGSIIEVEGYGVAIAADIGGGISGNEIDVYFAAEKTALNWGRKNVKVKVIE
jgi:3D (Asp-Asp-Asp) domain-containing protein